MFRKLLNSELNRPSTEEFKTMNKTPIIIILDNIRSSHNIGSAFRTADAFRIRSIYLCGISGCPPTPEIHKSALGAEFSMDWKYFGDSMDAVANAKKEGYTIISVEQAENSISLEKFIPKKNKKYAFVFGNEVKGVQQDIVDASDFPLEIPQWGTKHSLNISVSVGVILWQYITSTI
ncbi:MAG: RNA methyltransferase [Bacteroidales bacterium]